MKPEDGARRLLEEILARYESVEEFIGLLRVDPLVDTTELPPLSEYFWTLPT
ncbi:hypothetical protein [Nocardia brasiliensis]|uniref:hypothetical protein n=1 Tax=Nocardia brasiliensis TaxID=37326 RepID=UPI0002E32A25|nr:hypothetical protein [Nocardia brasiliensis]